MQPEEYRHDFGAGLLNEREVNDIAEAALRKRGPEDLGELAQSLMRHAEWPRAGFLNPMEEARIWAEMDCRDTLKAYVLARFRALPRKD
ncbi:MAG: hypothetical protein WA989_01535 [Henriciella sp.]|uniref:hypothetical protein n=1 Tax=Henriciella sp. TaxID=1968823 RepID=UPI003C72C145